MALDKRLLDILCCPVSKQPVGTVSSTQLEALNRAVDGSHLVNADGTRVTERLSAGLITRDGRTVYRVDDGIPVMLIDQSIATSQIEGFPR